MYTRKARARLPQRRAGLNHNVDNLPNLAWDGLRGALPFAELGNELTLRARRTGKRHALGGA